MAPIEHERYLLRLAGRSILERDEFRVVREVDDHLSVRLALGLSRIALGCTMPTMAAHWMGFPPAELRSAGSLRRKPYRRPTNGW